MNITIYSTSTCAICHAEMEWLDKNNMSYDDIIVDESDEAMNQLMTATGGMMQVPPFTVITKDDGTEEKVQGFDRKRLMSILGL
ncbi:MAG: glutaredoxin family protein [Candidatus Saccharimonadales bacterium]